MKFSRRLALAMVGGVALSASRALPAVPVISPESHDIWPGQAPGTESWTGPEERRPSSGAKGVRFNIVTNVTKPTVTVYRPDPKLANGTSVIVCPGGAFEILAYDMEGTEVAEWLAARGVTAFVLKYRVRPWRVLTPETRADPAPFEESRKAMAAGEAIAKADALQAVKFVRENAVKFAIQPDRIGMMGFSAGAMTTMNAVLAESGSAGLAFAAPIYGAMPDLPVPADAPPVFIAAAADDETVPVQKSVDIYTSWKAASRAVELHIYETGGHGFGMRQTGKTADRWPEAFELWMIRHGWMRGAA